MVNNEKLNQRRHFEMREWLLLFRHFQDCVKQGFPIKEETSLPEEQYDLAFGQMFEYWRKSNYIKIVVLERPEDDQDCIMLKTQFQSFKLTKS